MNSGNPVDESLKSCRQSDSKVQLRGCLLLTRYEYDHSPTPLWAGGYGTYIRANVLFIGPAVPDSHTNRASRLMTGQGRRHSSYMSMTRPLSMLPSGKRSVNAENRRQASREKPSWKATAVGGFGDGRIVRVRYDNQYKHLLVPAWHCKKSR